MTMHATETQPLPSLNGLSLTEMTAAATALAEDPTLAPATFRAKTTWQGQLRTQTDIVDYELGGKRIQRRHRIATDEPSELLGNDTAANPQDLLLAALNACMAVGFVGNATRLGVRLEMLEISSELTLDLRGAYGLDPNIPPGAPCIQYTIKVRGDGTREQFEEIHRAVMAVSPNRFHIAQPIPLESKLIVM